MVHRILELYSGIGGMHCAWNESGISGEVVAAIDINTVANNVYKHNFPKTNLMTRNIQCVTLKEFQALEIDTILMSPPCQPFTRNGKFLDENDARTKSFLAVLQLLDSLKTVKYILLENVKGFECSSVRSIFVETLKQCGFKFQDFLLCPSKFGVPNSRLRYYCIARRTEEKWNYETSDEIRETLTSLDYGTPYELGKIIEDNINDFLVPDKLLKRANIFDICNKSSRRSCCLTKSYSHYVEGTGSVYTEACPDEVEECYKEANEYGIGSEEYIKTMTKLKLRFLTPKECLSIMAFPEYYSFPENITNKQCYRLLGNSVNVKVISELIKVLFL